MEWYYIILIILSSLLLLLVSIDFVISYFLMKIMMEPYCAPLHEVLQNEYKLKKISIEEYENYYVTEEFTIQSRYGYNLKAFYIPKKKDIKFKDGKERVVILCHGWTARHETMYIYGKAYLEMGFHVFTYDHRNHGFSDKKTSTMGDKEADDLQTIIEFVYDKMGNNIILGTQGESMGSATVMINAGRYHSVDFVSEDCGYHDLKELLYHLCKYGKKLPTWPTLKFANLIFKLKAKSSFEICSPIQYIASCSEIPIYFTHGDNDDFVPSYMVYKCYDAKPGFKMINIYDCDNHAHDIVKYYDKYSSDLKKFLIKANIIN